MSRRCLFVCLTLAASGFALSAEPDATKTSAVPFDRLLWLATDLVLDHHVEPPARQQILLAGVKELLSKANKPIPADLSRRVSGVTTLEQFSVLVREIRPEKTDAEAESAAVEAALTTVPGRAHLFSPEEVKSQNTIENNNYVGIGIQIKMHDKEKLAGVVIPFPGGPFRRAGGRTGDLFVEVNGASQAGHSLRDVVMALRGAEGSEVTTLVRQPGSTETRLLKMVREVIPFQSAVGFRRIGEEAFEFRPDQTVPAAYIRLEQLTSSTYHELRRLERLLNSQGNHALVLDLRRTQPGSIVHAAQVADAFLDGGLMWRVRDARGRVTEYKADRDCLFRDWPMVVLVDGTTVETPAVIAAALQDRGRAILIGSPTAAGRTVKSLVTLPDGMGGVNMTTGTVERIKPALPPQLLPDHVVDLDTKRQEEMYAWHAGQISPEPPMAKAPEDPQLDKALDMLRDALKEKK
jgi:carboxyl-terminal processing protease